jgi:hypothetical protein
VGNFQKIKNINLLGTFPTVSPVVLLGQIKRKKPQETPLSISLKGLGHDIRIVLKWYGLIGLG